MGKPLRVLLVEDSEDDQELVARTLRRGGYDVSLERVDEALTMRAALATGAWDLVLSDFAMPNFSATAALKVLKESGLDLPFIIVSGSVGEQTAVAAMKAGAHDYVMKDNLARLVPAVERELREAEVRRDRRRVEEERARLLVSEQAARREAEAASRLKDEFLATVSHELRTPLTAIIGWTHLLRQRQMDEGAAARALEIIERNARSQARLVEDLLDVSRIITGKVRLETRPVALLPVVEAAVESMRPAADAKGIHVVTALDAAAGPVSGDPDRLQQIVWNLLSNAIKFTPAGGRVEVRLGRAATHAEVMISDTGQGIRPEFLPFVFDRFRQADMTSTRAHGGLGLGLGIARHLVEMHGGTIEAASAGEGRGSTFTVRFPLAAPSEHPSAEESGRPASAEKDRTARTPVLEGVRVLVVDDEQDVREMLAVILKLYGAEVFAADSADEAFEAIGRERPDVILSDIGMPDGDGYSLIRRVRSLPEGSGGRTPAVALTAYARTEDRRRVLDAGYQMHVPKPIDPVELVGVIASLIR